MVYTSANVNHNCDSVEMYMHEQHSLRLSCLLSLGKVVSGIMVGAAVECRD